MPKISSSDQICTVIVRCEVDPSIAKQYVENARETAETMKTLPGFISFSMLASEDGTEVMTYLQWKSIENHRFCETNPMWKDHSAGKKTYTWMTEGKVKMHVKTYAIPFVVEE